MFSLVNTVENLAMKCLIIEEAISMRNVAVNGFKKRYQSQSIKYLGIFVFSY